MIINTQEYWSNRYARQGGMATGYCGHSSKEMEESYQRRVQWLDERLPKDRALVLDFGAGVGRYRHLFSGTYIGYEPFAPVHLLKDAQRGEPESPDSGMFFTATVLQHNTDEEVLRVLGKYSGMGVFWLYEFTGSTGAKHVASRGVDDYANFVETASGKKIEQAFTHHEHGQPHTLMVFK